MYSLLKDISLLTKVPLNVLLKIELKCEDSICYDIYENNLKLLPITDIDIGIGTLLIKLEDDSIFYKFVPSESFENQVIKVVELNYNPLADKVETSLTSRIMNVYKELY